MKRICNYPIDIIHDYSIKLYLNFANGGSSFSQRGRSNQFYRAIVTPKWRTGELHDSYSSN